MLPSRIIQVPMKLLKIPVKKPQYPRMFSEFNYKLVNRNKYGVTTRVLYLFRRCLSIQKITNNIKLYTEKPRKIVIDSKTLRLKQDHGNRPLTLILPFLGAQQKHLIKFANIYHSQGFDVVVGQIAPWNLFVPAFKTQPVAADIVKFLLNNDYYDKIFIHGFSVGVYIYGECILHMLQDMYKYQGIIDRVQGEIWDSVPNYHAMASGVSRSVFLHNPILQKSLESVILFYLRTFTALTTDYIKKSYEIFHYTKNIHAPSLFFLSKSDVVSTEPSIRHSIALFEKMNVKCTWKCFDKSSHVEHFRLYREEYCQTLIDHLHKVKMLKKQRT